MIPSHWGLRFGTFCEGCRPAVISPQHLWSLGGLALRVREEPLPECEADGSSQVPTPPSVRHRASVLVTQGSHMPHVLVSHAPSAQLTLMTHSYWAVDIAKAAREDGLQQAMWGCLRGHCPQTLVCDQMLVKRSEQWAAFGSTGLLPSVPLQAGLLWTI